ncbi:hypothetical protein [Aromatoleum evansii]|uniref:hypothetical protein n=1 Tax=Aromatoleum evansii TaxID=59406 RepID=UPI00145D3061|nr:hypothetical protein [Aromatoleum evansii]NMG29563.1 hypothetical protein [Aromatoleum evansii]
MFQKLKESLDVGLFLLGIALIAIAVLMGGLSMAQKVWLLSLASMTEFWLMKRVVYAEIAQSRRYPTTFWRKLAPGTLPFIVGAVALAYMLNLVYG